MQEPLERLGSVDPSDASLARGAEMSRLWLMTFNPPREGEQATV